MPSLEANIRVFELLNWQKFLCPFNVQAIDSNRMWTDKTSKWAIISFVTIIKLFGHQCYVSTPKTISSFILNERFVEQRKISGFQSVSLHALVHVWSNPHFCHFWSNPNFRHVQSLHFKYFTFVIFIVWSKKTGDTFFHIQHKGPCIRTSGLQIFIRCLFHICFSLRLTFDLINDQTMWPNKTYVSLYF